MRRSPTPQPISLNPSPLHVLYAIPWARCPGRMKRSPGVPPPGLPSPPAPSPQGLRAAHRGPRLVVREIHEPPTTISSRWGPPAARHDDHSQGHVQHDVLLRPRPGARAEPPPGRAARPGTPVRTRTPRRGARTGNESGCQQPNAVRNRGTQTAPRVPRVAHPRGERDPWHKRRNGSHGLFAAHAPRFGSWHDSRARKTAETGHRSLVTGHFFRGTPRRTSSGSTRNPRP